LLHSFPRLVGYHGLDALLLFYSKELFSGSHHLRRHLHGGSSFSEDGLEIKE
jgi:hypothetical protein